MDSLGHSVVIHTASVHLCTPHAKKKTLPLDICVRNSSRCDYIGISRRKLHFLEWGPLVKSSNSTLRRCRKRKFKFACKKKHEASYKTHNNIQIYTYDVCRSAYGSNLLQLRTIFFFRMLYNYLKAIKLNTHTHTRSNAVKRVRVRQCADCARQQIKRITQKNKPN